MPNPTPNETEQEFVDRCIPIVLEEGTAQDGSQAAAICHSKWDESKKSKSIRPKKSKSIYDLELKDLNEKQGIVSFYFASWTPDQENDQFAKTAYTKTFKENKNNIYHNRDHREAVGMPITLGVDEFGAFAVSQLAMKTIAGRDTFEQYQAGLIKGHSQEFQTIIDEMDHKSGVRIIKEARLWGVTSVTNIPAQLDTPIISMKSNPDDVIAQLEKINKALRNGKISDDLGRQLELQMKALNELIRPEQKPIDWKWIADNL